MKYRFTGEGGGVCYINVQNYQIWSTKKPNMYQEVGLPLEKVGIWCTISKHPIYSTVLLNKLEYIHMELLVVTTYGWKIMFSRQKDSSGFNYFRCFCRVVSHRVACARFRGCTNFTKFELLVLFKEGQKKEIMAQRMLSLSYYQLTIRNRRFSTTISSVNAVSKQVLSIFLDCLYQRVLHCTKTVKTQTI